MKILQNDIFGNQHDNKPEKEKKPSMAASKNFPTVALRDGFDEVQTNANSMLSHRILQKKMIYGGLRSDPAKEVFMKILRNELSIKTGAVDSVSATRDSLISFFTINLKK